MARPHSHRIHTLRAGLPYTGFLAEHARGAHPYKIHQVVPDSRLQAEAALRDAADRRGHIHPHHPLRRQFRAAELLQGSRQAAAYLRRDAHGDPRVAAHTPRAGTDQRRPQALHAGCAARAGGADFPHHSHPQQAGHPAPDPHPDNFHGLAGHTGRQAAQKSQDNRRRLFQHHPVHNGGRARHGGDRFRAPEHRLRDMVALPAHRPACGDGHSRPSRPIRDALPAPPPPGPGAPFLEGRTPQGRIH